MISPDVLKSAAAVIPSAKGTLPPIQITTSTISSQAHLQMISHWHDELEFIYILDGKMDFHIEEKILTASRGDFLAIHASAMHRSAPHNGEDCRFIRALIHPSLLTENQSVRNRLLSPLLGNTSRRCFLVPSASPDAPRLGELLREINRINEKHLPGFELESIGLLHILLARLYALFPPEKQTQEDMPGTDISAQRRMVAYISHHYPEKISLAGIAAAGSVSRSKCCQLFKKYMQQSPGDQPQPPGLHGKFHFGNRKRLRLLQPKLLYENVLREIQLHADTIPQPPVLKPPTQKDLHKLNFTSDL